MGFIAAKSAFDTGLGLKFVSRIHSSDRLWVLPVSTGGTFSGTKAQQACTQNNAMGGASSTSEGVENFMQGFDEEN